MGWTLVVDFGTTSTSAAIVDGVDVELLDVDGLGHMPSAVRREDSGLLVVGAGAVRAGWAPETVENAPKRSLGEESHLMLGGVAVEVVDAVAAVLSAVLEEGTRRRNGLAPDTALLTHPARWTDPERAAFVDAATRAGLPHPQLVPEPVAAAAHERDLAPDQLLAVYDLGGTFAAAVLRRTTSGFELLAHGGRADQGSEHLDDLLVAHVGKQIERSRPDVWAGLVAGDTETLRRRATELRRDVRTAKESLSRHRRHIVPVSAADDVLITRDELEDVVGEAVAGTVADLVATIAEAGATPDQITRYSLVGGGSHIPLVARRVAEAAGVTPTAGSAPEKSVVLGAGRIALSTLAAATTAVIPIVTAEFTTDATAAGERGSTHRAEGAPAARSGSDGRAAARRTQRKRTWRRPAVLLPLGAAAGAVAVAAVTTIALQQRAQDRVVDAASAATAQVTPAQVTPAPSTPAPSTPAPATFDDEPATATTNAPPLSPAINGPSQVAVGDSDHYTATYEHPELVASCRWTDITGKVVRGCGWLPVSFADARSYTLQFTIVEASGETHTATKTIIAT